jgi:membrane protease YdiL (CAAX protease family)
LTTRVGRWKAIISQAVLFSLHPGHWAQGWPHLASILGFGLLAGWLVERRGSIWAAWGAHGFANVLPEILRSIG